MSKPSTKPDKPPEGYPYHTIEVGGGWGVFVLYMVVVALAFVVLKAYKAQEPCENVNHPVKEVQK